MIYQVIAAIKPGLWAVKRRGAKRALKLFVDFESAYEYGKEIADHMQAELFVHNRNGVIIEKRSAVPKLTALQVPRDKASTGTVERIQYD